MPPEGDRRRRPARGRAPHPVRDRRGVPRSPHGRQAQRAARSHPGRRQEGQGHRLHDRRRAGGLLVRPSSTSTASRSATSSRPNFPGEDDEAVALIDIGASIMKTNVLRSGRHDLRPRHPLRRQQLHAGHRPAAQHLVRAGRGGQARQGRRRQVGDAGAAAGGGVARPLAGGAADLRLLRVDGRVRAHRQDRAGRRLRPAARAERVPVVELGHPGRAGPAVRAHRGRRRPTRDDVDALAPALAVAVGLALRRPGDKEQPK